MTGGNPHYRRGHAAELRAKARLEEQGYTCFRTAGSKTPCDLIAVRPGDVSPLCLVSTSVADDLSFDYAPGQVIPVVDARDVQVVPREPRLVFVQVKNGQRPMPRRERDAFKAFALEHGARPLLIERGNKWSWLDEVGGVVGEAA